MDEGRESVGLAIPFTAGIAAVNYSLQAFYISGKSLDTAASAALAMTLVLAGILWTMLKGHHGHSPENGISRAVGGRMGLWILFLVTGAAVALINAIPHVSGPEDPGPAEICSEHLKSLIRSVPLSDTGNNALMTAFLTGDQSDLDRTVKDAFRESGASHLLALSGMHLSIIYLVVSKILSVLGNTPAVRFGRSAAIITGSAFFTVMTGAVPSLVRAFFFILLRECALLTGRSRDSINIFCTALILQLAITPSVVTSAGFQLSYLAMLGIFLLYRPIDRLWDRYGTEGDQTDGQGHHDGHSGSMGRDDILTMYPDNQVSDTMPEDGHGGSGILRIITKTMRYIWSMCALSIACQTFTAPVVLLYFGTFPQYFLITNLLCIPLSNLIMVLSIVILPLHAAGICPEFLTDADNLLLTALTDILGIIQAM